VITLSTSSMRFNVFERHLTISIGDLETYVSSHKGILLPIASWTQVVNHIADRSNAQISINSHHTGKTVRFCFFDIISTLGFLVHLYMQYTIQPLLM